MMIFDAELRAEGGTHEMLESLAVFFDCYSNSKVVDELASIVGHNGFNPEAKIYAGNKVFYFVHNDVVFVIPWDGGKVYKIRQEIVAEVPQPF